MVFIQLFLLCISVVAYATDEKQKPLQLNTVKIQFENNAESEYKHDVINYFKFIDTMIKDLNQSNEAVPLDIFNI